MSITSGEFSGRGMSIFAKVKSSGNQEQNVSYKAKSKEAHEKNPLFHENLYTRKFKGSFEILGHPGSFLQYRWK